MSEQSSLLTEGISLEARPNNWPGRPWPRPFIHHDIEGEIIPAKRRMVTIAYYSVWLFLATCIWNVISWMAYWIALGSALIAFMLSMTWLFVLVPTVFCVYLCLYRSIRTASTFYMCMFMCLNGLYIGTMVFFGLGFQFSGAGGVFSMINCFGKNGNLVVAIFMIIDLIGWSCVGLLQLYVMTQILMMQRQASQGSAPDDFEKQTVDYAYQNRAVLSDVATQISPADASRVAQTVYAQPDDVGAAYTAYNQSLPGATQGANYYNTGGDSDGYDPRSVFG